MLEKFEANTKEGKDGWVLSPSFLLEIKSRLDHSEECPSLEQIEMTLLAFNERQKSQTKE